MRRWLAERTSTGADDWFLVSRARHGMTTVFEALAGHYGKGEVITQPLTCVTAVNPILVAGHRPVYADIAPDTLGILPEDVAAHLNANTRAVVVQHSFGMPAAIEPVARLVRHGSGVRRDREALIIEDAAHYLGLLKRGEDGRPVADVSVHSFGAEKMLRTKYGGAIWVNPNMADADLRALIVSALQTVPVTGTWGRLQVAAYPYFNRVLHTAPAGLRPAVARLFRLTGLFVQPIMPVETQGKNYGVCRKPSAQSLQSVLREFAGYDEQLTHRRARVNQYAHGLAEAACRIPGGALGGDRALVRFPLVLTSAEQAEKAFRHLQRTGLHPGKWYRPLLFPGVNASLQEEVYGYQTGQCPVAEDISARIINLPTGLPVSEQTAKEIMRELRNTIAA